MRLAEGPLHVSVTIHVDPRDVRSCLNNNDELTLQFICQLVALSHSSDLREDLLQRLGVGFEEVGQGRVAPTYDPRTWQDEDYLPEGVPEEPPWRGVDEPTNPG